MESPNEKQMFGSDWTNSTFFVQVKEGAYCLLCPDSQKNSNPPRNLRSNGIFRRSTPKYTKNLLNRVMKY